jgi:para-nitrobenzyl esterase
MMLQRLLASTAVIAAALFAIAADAQIRDPVRLDAGRIRGTETEVEGIRVFKGIPFAAPPVGALRWRMPQPVETWSGVRDASEFGNICIQPPGRGRLNIAVLPDSPPMSEDCLYLNVWTPADSRSDALPVMVYFYGGAWTEGAGSIPLYDGTALAQKGVIVVTMNYRLGAFGFFAHPALTLDSGTQASGNYGLGDKIAALQWVRANIEAFGGDPQNVTVFGQSAGAASIATLVASPLADGLFQRAISQSGTWMGLGPSNSMRTRASAEEAGVGQAEATGASTARELRALAADDVVRHLRSAGVIVDGWVIPEDPNAVFEAGRQNSVDVLTGSNKNDSFFPAMPDLEAFRRRMSGQWGDLAERYFAAYPAMTGEEAAAMTSQTSNDGTFWISRIFAEFQRKRGNRAWVYQFAQNPPGGNGPEFPAAHAAEIPYVFDNLGELPLFPDGSIAYYSGTSQPDARVADMMSSYWTNFAKTGDPNGPGLPRWPEHSGLDAVNAMILDADPATESLPTLERMQLFDARYYHRGH